MFWRSGFGWSWVEEMGVFVLGGVSGSTRVGGVIAAWIVKCMGKKGREAGTGGEACCGGD